VLGFNIGKCMDRFTIDTRQTCGIYMHAYGFYFTRDKMAVKYNYFKWMEYLNTSNNVIRKLYIVGRSHRSIRVQIKACNIRWCNVMKS